MKTILLISPYWKEEHRWMVSSVKLADLWQRRGYKVIAVCMGSSSRVEEVSDTLTVHYRKDIFIPDPWNYGIAFGFTSYIKRLIRSEKPDHIVANKILFWTSLCVIPLKLTGHKVTLITDAFVGMTWWPRGLVPRIGAFLYAHTLGWLIMLSAQRVVTFHPQPGSLLRRLGIAKKTQVIPTGIDPTPIDGTQKQKKGNTITYVGRLESIKGVDDFLAAIVPLKKEYPSWKIQVVGWYKEGHPLVEQYQREVVFTGLRKDIGDILSASDIFVMPSHSEGLSNAVMEAMSAACACIVSEVGGNTYLTQNGVSGFHYPAGDREALRAHVKRLIDDPAKRTAMGAEARKRIDEEFSWEKVGKMYQDFFESL
jgi:glycosyltransferase involved in cell wall biosynthesis